MTTTNLGASGTYGTDAMTRARADLLGIGWQRITMAWDVVQPARDVWNWQQMDATVSAWSHLRVCALLHRWPSWVCSAVSGQGTWLVTADELVDRYAIFAEAVRARYGDVFAMVQPVNEPWSNNLPVGGDGAKVAPLCARLGMAAREAFPHTALAGASMQAPTLHNAQESHRAAGFPADWIDYHDYSAQTVNPPVADYLSSHRAVWGYRPVVVSELGIFESAGPDRAASVARQYSADPLVVCFVQNLLGSGNPLHDRDGFTAPGSMTLRPSMAAFMAAWGGTVTVPAPACRAVDHTAQLDRIESKLVPPSIPKPSIARINACSRVTDQGAAEIGAYLNSIGIETIP